jgi:hypothetical protein
MTLRVSSVFIGAALVAMAAACGGSATAPSSSSSSSTTVATSTVYYNGTFTLTGGATQGTLTATASIPTAAVLLEEVSRPMATYTATGVLRLSNGTSITLTGSYDSATGKWTLSGSGYSVTFTTGTSGTSTGTTTTGTITSPTGVGGSVAAVRVADAATAPTMYCGTFGLNSANSGLGVMSFGVSGTLVTGIGTDSTGSVALNGTLSGTSLNATYKYGVGSGGGTVIGTISGTTGSGTWSNTDNERGAWAAATGNCK